MHVKIANIVLVGLLIGDCGEPSEAILVEERVKFWGHLGHEHVKPQIEFLLVDQIRERFVLLHHLAALVSGNVLDSSRQKDSFSLA